MAENQIVDEVVSERPAAGRGRAARVVHQETIAADGAVKILNGGIEQDSHSDAPRQGRAFKQSTLDLLSKLDKEDAGDEDEAPLAPHEQGDADEDEPDDAAAAPVGDADEAVDEGADVADAGGEPDDAAPAAGVPDPVKEWQTKAQTLEERNRALLTELDTARSTPKSKRSERETTLLAAEAAYIDEGSVPALRKFLSVIVGAAPDSKEVTAELTGLYADLTSQEVGVPLDQSQQAFRDNARTRLLLARDRREKADSEKKAEPGNDAGEAVQYERAAQHLDNLLVTKSQNGTSVADEYPMLMALAQDFDGYKPSEVLARAIRQEIMTGTLDPSTTDIDMVRAVAPKIEQHYDAVAKKIEAARAKKNKQPGTTTPSVTPKVKVEAATETRQGTGARTITTATASRAPATTPKETKQKAAATGEKTRKDFKTDAAWKEHLLSKHFAS